MKLIMNNFQQQEKATIIESVENDSRTKHAGKEYIYSKEKECKKKIDKYKAKLDILNNENEYLKRQLKNNDEKERKAKKYFVFMTRYSFMREFMKRTRINLIRILFLFMMAIITSSAPAYALEPGKITIISKSISETTALVYQVANYNEKKAFVSTNEKYDSALTELSKIKNPQEKDYEATAQSLANIIQSSRIGTTNMIKISRNKTATLENVANGVYLIMDNNNTVIPRIVTIPQTKQGKAQNNITVELSQQTSEMKKEEKADEEEKAKERQEYLKREDSEAKKRNSITLKEKIIKFLNANFYAVMFTIICTSSAGAMFLLFKK